MRALIFSSRRAAALLAVIALAACRGRTGPVAPAPNVPEETVSQFLGAVNARDLDRMALLWGTERGPSTISNPNEPDVQRRQLEIMQRVLVADSHRVAGNEPVAGDNGRRRRLMVEMVRGTRRALVGFTMVSARTGGWLVLEVDLDAAMALVRPGS